jgi:hypothetical protein
MKGRKFHTVPDELLHVAEAVAQFMEGRGCRVQPEKRIVGFPFCPTLLCKRDHTTYAIEVAAGVELEKLMPWVAYGKSCGEDFRVVVALPLEAGVDAAMRDVLEENRIGLVELEDGICHERVAPVDLSLNVELPDPRRMSAAVRALTGQAYEHFERGNWREGFQAAAQALEAEARRYLSRHASRCAYVGKAPTRREIGRMTLGGLARTFANIGNQNSSDHEIGTVLDLINKDRIGVVHHRDRRRSEARLRVNVGRHMWAICSAMEHAVN